jgi:AcrR family transcriptional regulator
MAPSRRRPSAPLPRGRHALDPDATAGHHRQRLRDATVELVAEVGYGETTMEALASAAGVSSATLYGLYAGKRELVVDAARATLAVACEELGAHAETPPAASLPDAFGAVLQTVAALVKRNPDAARLTLIDIAGTGAPGADMRVQVARDLQRRLVAAVPGPTSVSEAASAVLAGGTLQLLEQHLLADRLRTLRTVMADLAAWGAGYETTSPLALPAPQAAPYGGRVRPRSPRSLPLPSGRRALPAVFVTRHQRLRIREAVVDLAADEGLASASVRDLSKRAGISRDTYYQHYSDKDGAVRAAYDDAFVELFASSWYAAAAHADWPSEVRAATTALLQFAAAEPELARFGLLDVRSAGRDAAVWLDGSHNAFARLLARGHDAAGDRKVPALVPHALTGGVASLIAAWIVDGRAAELPGLAPHLTYILLTPFLGELEARRAAGVDEGVQIAQGTTSATGDERQRLVNAFAELVREKGFRAARLTDAAQQAGVELDLALGLFEDEVDLTNHAVDAWAGQLVVSATGAFVSSTNDPAVAAHRALAVALQYMADTPALTALAAVEEPALAAADVARRERFMNLFFELISDQVPEQDNVAQRPRATLMVVLGGMLAAVRAYAREDRLQELPGELATLSQQCLTPFFGAETAARVAALPAFVGDTAQR